MCVEHAEIILRGGVSLVGRETKLSHGSGGRKWQHYLPLFELAFLLMRFNHIASIIANANQP